MAFVESTNQCFESRLRDSLTEANGGLYNHVFFNPAGHRRTQARYGFEGSLGCDAEPGRAMKVDLITDRQRFAALKPVWNQVLERSQIRHPFVTHEWISAWWDNFQHTGMPYILTVKDGSSITAIAHLMLDRGTMYGYPVRRLHGMANVYTERFELLLGERPYESAEALCAYLKSHADYWDVFELRHVPADSPTLACLPGLAEHGGCLAGRWPSMESPYVAIRDSWDDYYKGLKKVHRADMRKRMANLEQQGPVQMEVVQSDKHLEQDFADALRLESSAWKGAQGTAIESRPDSQAFYRHVISMAAENKWLRLYFLTVGGKRIAVRIALFLHNTLYMLKSGYDPQYAPWSPAHLLCDQMLREAWDVKFAEADFLGNAERWKLSWSNGLRPHFYVFLFPPRPMPRLLHHLKFSLIPRLRRTPLDALLRRCVSRLGITTYKE
jgi:CelD/BcsL family acetyltransferase involved in cellulose biosynthesis